MPPRRRGRPRHGAGHGALPRSPKMCSVDIALEVVGLVVVTVVVAGLCLRFDWPAPLVLIAAGVGISFIPGTPEFELDPHVVLVGLLPPLLYAAAIRTS